MRAPFLSRIGIAWRILAMMVCTGLLLVGGLTKSEVLFPFGILSQYSGAVDPDGTVTQACLEGIRADGTRTDITLNSLNVGVKRSEIENQVDRFQKNPEVLKGLADTYNSRPWHSPVVGLRLCMEQWPLRNGGPTGQITRTTVAQWGEQ